MPPKKRALEEGDANAQLPPNKRSSTGKAASTGSGKEQSQPADDSQQRDKPDKNGTNKQDDEYICITRPMFDIVEQLKSEEPEEDEEDLEEKAFEQHSRLSKEMWGEPAVDHPEYKWTIVWEAWKMLCELHVKQTHVCPDNFDMHVFSDFEGFGINYLIQSRIAEFSKEWNKKTNRSLQHMWAIMASLAHWLVKSDVTEPWIGIEDGEGVSACIGIIGNAFLSILEIMDLEGQLKPGSKYLDLGLVMSLHLEWSKGMEDYGIDGAHLKWRQAVVAYAAKSGIDLTAAGCYNTAQILEEEELQGFDPINGSPNANRWAWAKNFGAFKRKHGLGEVLHAMVSSYDITKWSRAERAKHNFDGIDPLKDIPEKEIKAGNVMLGPQ